MGSRQVVPPPPPGFTLEDTLPPGFVLETPEVGAALRGATISEAPWYQKEVPLARLLSLGVKGPEAVENALPRVSAADALGVLPAAGGALGGLIGGVGGAALGGAGGEAMRQNVMRIIGAHAPQTSEEAAKGIVVEGAIQGGVEGLGVLAGKGLKAGGQRLMHSALKPNPSLMREYGTTAPKLVKTLLDEGVNVTPGGIEKLQLLFDATNAEIKDAVRNAKGLIQKNTVAARALPTAQKMAEQVNPKQALKDVGGTVQKFLEHPTIPGPLTIREAQAMKIGTYRQIGKDYGKLSSASIETQKALARGLKEEIELAIPEIKALNARDAELMAALDAVGHRVSIAGNRDPVGFAWVTQTPRTFLAALMDRSPVIKSMLARGMFSSAGAAAKVSPQLIRAAVVAVASDGSDAEPVPK